MSDLAETVLILLAWVVLCVGLALVGLAIVGAADREQG